MSGADEHCRIDIWLWRARFCKTRGLAARMVEDGRVRLRRGGAGTRLDKPSRTIRPGDHLVLDLGLRETIVRVEALGARRGPAPEARTLYSAIDASSDGHDEGQPPGSGEPRRRRTFAS